MVRFGERCVGAAGRHTSRTDLPLTEYGRAQARELGAELGRREFGLVLCSPLRRARETCELAGFGNQAVICDDLREWEYGEYEGLTTLEIREHNPGWSVWRDGCPGGESPRDVAARAGRVLSRVRRAARRTAVFQRTVYFAHGPARCLWRQGGG